MEGTKVAKSPGKKLDLTGCRFGRLTVLRPAETTGGRTGWVCRCDCGCERIVKTQDLRSGHTSSCGCLRRETKGVPLTYVDGTCVEMLRAKTVRRNNTSGVPGVDWRPSKRKWRAAICFQGKRYNLGSFSKLEDAAAARHRAEEDLHDSFVRRFTEAAEAPPPGGKPSGGPRSPAP